MLLAVSHVFYYMECVHFNGISSIYALFIVHVLHIKMHRVCVYAFFSFFFITAFHTLFPILIQSLALYASNSFCSLFSIFFFILYASEIAFYGKPFLDGIILYATCCIYRTIIVCLLRMTIYELFAGANTPSKFEHHSLECNSIFWFFDIDALLYILFLLFVARVLYFIKYNSNEGCLSPFDHWN